MRVAVAGGLITLVASVAGFALGLAMPFGGRLRDVEERLLSIEADNAALRTEATSLRTRNSLLESETAMLRGAQDAMTRQSADVAAENAELKEKAAFLQELLADTNKEPGMTMPRLSLERQSEDVWRYSLLIVRGGNPRDEFAGRVELLATLLPTDRPESPPRVLTLPDDQPETAASLKLAFRYYQRIEGTFHAPSGMRVAALEARAFEYGNGTPRAQRAVQLGLSTP